MKVSRSCPVGLQSATSAEHVHALDPVERRPLDERNHLGRREVLRAVEDERQVDHERSDRLELVLRDAPVEDPVEKKRNGDSPPKSSLSPNAVIALPRLLRLG